MIALFGAIGTLARYGVSVLMPPVAGQMPWNTLAVNITGGFLVGLLSMTGAPAAVFVGFIGGFTTFSAYCLETTQLFESGAVGTAWAYWALSPILGLGAAFLGIIAGRMLA